MPEGFATYRITDDNTGHTYEVEVPEDYTEDQIMSEIQSWEAANPAPSPVQSPQTPAVSPVQPTQRAPAPQAPVATPEAPLQPNAMHSNSTGGVLSSFNIEQRNRPDAEAALQALWDSGERDPEAFNSLSEYLGIDTSRARMNPADVARLEQRDEFFRTHPTFNRTPNFTANEATGEVAPETPDTITEEIGTGFMRGEQQLGNTLRGAAALGADLVGADETAQQWAQDYTEQQAAINLHYGSSVESMRDIESFGDAGRYAASIIGEMVPDLMSSLGAGYVAKEATSAVATRAMRNFVEDRVAAGVTREAAEAQLLQATQQLVQRGTTAGITAMGVTQEAGATYGNTYAQTGEQAPWSSLAAGMVSGSLDSIIPNRIMSQITPSLRSRLTSRILREGAEGLAIEGSTEAIQEFIGQLPQSVVTGESPFTYEMYLQMEEAFVRGGVGGGAVSGGTSMMAGVDQIPPARPSLEGRFGFTNSISRPTANRTRATRLYPQQLQRTAQQMADRVADFTDNWAERPQVTVHPTFNDLPNVDNDALGAYMNGEIVLNAEAIVAEADNRGLTIDEMVAGITFHEGLGHHALTREFGEGLDTTLESFYDNGTPGFRDTVNSWMDNNPEAYAGDPDRHIRAVEEVIAEYAENDGQLPASMMDQLKNYVKGFARRVGVNLRVSEREVRAILGVAQRNLVEGRGQGQENISFAPKFAREQSTSAGFRRPRMDDRAIREDQRVRRDLAAKNTDAEIEAAIRAGIDPAEVGLPSSPRYAKPGSDRTRLTRKYGERRTDGTIGFSSGGNVIGPETEAAKTFLRELGVFNSGELARMGGEDAILRAERLGIDDEWLEYYNDAYLRSYYGEDSAPNTPQPDMSRYMPDTPKYARPQKPITVEDLTAEELVESRNALSLLDHLVDDVYSKTSFTSEELLLQATMRGVPPSVVASRADLEPGKLTKDMIRYDIAAQKLNGRLTNLYAKMLDGTANQKDRVEFTKTTLALDDVASNLFKFQSEAGRLLNAIKKMEFTHKKVTSLREALKGLDGLADGAVALDDPDTFLRYAKAVMAQMEQNKVDDKGKVVYHVLNLPRAIMSSMDLSAPLRQGLYFINTSEFWRALPGMFKAFNPKNGEDFYQATWKEIQSRPSYELMLQAGISFSSLDGHISQREEDFQSEIAEKIPGVRMSNRAYTGFLNKLRADLFDRYVAEMTKAGMGPTSKENLRGLGSWINAGTGRGNLSGKTLQAAAPMLNALFFSPRLISSRVTLLSPRYYKNLPPHVRKAAIKQSIAFGAIAVMTLNLLSLAIPEAEIEEDPRSSDFGKVRVGDTRYDVLGGFSQYLTLGARLGSYALDEAFGFDVGGHRKTTAGDLIDYSPEYGATTALGAVGDFFRNKSSPNASLVYDFLAGEDTVGNEFTFSDAIVSRITPMILQDFIELSEEHGIVEGAAMSAPVMFGVGVNTYTPAQLDTEQELETSETFGAADYDDMSNEFVTVVDGEATLSELGKEMWDNSLNHVFADIMEQRIAEPDWPNLSDAEKEEEIRVARNDARRETKDFMLVEMGM